MSRVSAPASFGMPAFFVLSADLPNVPLWAAGSGNDLKKGDLMRMRNGTARALALVAALAVAGFAGSAQAVPQFTPAVDVPEVPTLDIDQWPVEALALLEVADAALRAGDFQGFGEALDELRALLEQLSSGTVLP